MALDIVRTKAFAEDDEDYNWQWSAPSVVTLSRSLAAAPDATFYFMLPRGKSATRVAFEAMKTFAKANGVKFPDTFTPDVAKAVGDISYTLQNFRARESDGWITMRYKDGGSSHRAQEVVMIGFPTPNAKCKYKVR